MRTIENLLTQMRSLDIRLYEESGDLCINAPKGVLTPGLQTELRDRKPEILGFLKEARQKIIKEEGIPRASREGKLPLSFAQQRMWFLNQLEGEIATYHIPFAIRLIGMLHIDALRSAFLEILRRHEALRTSFPSEDGQPVQKIHDHLELPLMIRNLREIPLERLSLEVNEIIREESHRPFNLTTGPLFRICLLIHPIQIGGKSVEEYTLLVILHGIVGDGWTAGIFVNELSVLYEAFVNGKPSPLPELPIQYLDFTVWQRQRLTGLLYEKQLVYWKRELEDIPLSLDLPYDFSRHQTHHFLGKRADFQLPKELNILLNRLRQELGVSMFMILFAAFSILLYRWSGQEDIPIGTPVANRIHKDIESLIGFFVNTLVLRADLSGEPDFFQFLHRVRRMTLDAYANQDIPFERLVEEIQPERSMAHSPLFQVMFVMQNAPHDDLEFGGLKISNLDVQLGVAHFDLVMVMTESSAVLGGFLEYNSSLFKLFTIDRLLIHFQKIIENIALHALWSQNHLMPEKHVQERKSSIEAGSEWRAKKNHFRKAVQKIGQIPIISEIEKKRVLFQWNQTNRDIPFDQPVHRLFETMVMQNGNVIAVVYNNQNIAYHELNIRANQLANLLIERGVEPDEVVAIKMDRSLEMMIVVLSILKAGAVCLPIDPEYPAERILKMLIDSSVQVLISRQNIIDAFSYTSLQGLELGHSNDIVVSPGRENISDFDVIPFPDRSLVDYNLYQKFIGLAPVKHTVNIMASRGCPFNCIYCHKIWPKKQFYRSARNIFEEVRFYYDLGIRRIAFVDDIFNLDKKISGEFFQMAIDHLPGVQFFFPNGLRGDVFNKDYIDLMVKAGTVDLAVALESGSPRIQKLIRKNLNLDKFLENTQYIAEKYPQVILEMQTMFGFPTETEEEALMTLNFIKQIRWIHFPNLHVLKVFPNSEMCRLALESGISPEDIKRSANLRYHDLPDTLPYSKSFGRQFQARYMKEYFLNKERILHVLPNQMKLLSENEMVQKYDSFLPDPIKSLDDILSYVGISREELGNATPMAEDIYAVPDFSDRIQNYSVPASIPNSANKPIRILLLDLSSLFAGSETMLHHQIDEPLGLMYLMTYLKQVFGKQIIGRIAKSRIEIENFQELKQLLEEFKPQIIGLRTLSVYRDFFHKSIGLIRQWVPDAAIIVGGPYITSEYETLLLDFNIDIAVLGEGEITFAELVGKCLENNGRLPTEKDLKVIPGIAFIPQEKRQKLRKQGVGRQILMMDHLSGELEKQDVKNITAGLNSSLLAYVLYTSGSTGQSKGVAMGHQALSNLVHWHLRDNDLARRARTLQFASLTFDVSFQEIFSTWCNGGTLILINEEIRRDFPALKQYINENCVDRLFFPYVAFQQLAQTVEDDGNPLKGIREIITAGEQLQISAAIRGLVEKLGDCTLHNHYGPTETHVVTSFTLKDDMSQWPTLPPIGHPIFNTRIYLLDGYMQPVPIGIKGEIYIGGLNLAQGYINRPEWTADRFIMYSINGKENIRLYRSGDMARYSQEGAIEFLGRKDQQVKIRGYRIEPGEIESLISNYPIIQQAVVLIREHSLNIKGLVAYITLNKGKSSGKLNTQKLREFLENQLPDYMIPAEYMIVESFPLTSSGKINRRKLSETYIPGQRLKRSIPRSPIEDILVKIWEEILGQINIGIHDNFFMLGGHSLLATQVISRIRKALNVDLPLRVFFEAPTISSFSKQVDIARNKENRSSGPCLEPIARATGEEIFPLSFSQERLWKLEKSYPGELFNNISGALCLSGALEVSLLEKTIKHIIQRHEILRTTYILHNGKPGQLIHEEFSINLPQRDLRKISPALQEKVIDEITLEETRKSFELEKDILMRFLLLRLEENSYVLLFTIHHIAFDGWSLGIMVHEMSTIYSDLLKGNAPSVPSLPIQYVDYAVQQRLWLSEPSQQHQLNYWKNQLCQLPQLQLPTDYPRSKIKNFAASSQKFKIPIPLADKLKKLAAKLGASLFMILLTGFALLLSRRSQQKDFAVGTSIANRHFNEIESLIGYFVNTLIIRADFTGDPGLKELIRRVRHTCLDAYAHQDIPIEIILNEIYPGIEKMHPPMVQVMFILQNAPVQELELQGLTMSSRDIPVANLQYELQCTMFEGPGMLEGILVYNKGLFNAETIQCMIHEFSSILKEMVGKVF